MVALWNSLRRIPNNLRAAPAAFNFPRMKRYYDQKTEQCDYCCHYQPGHMPDGTEYMVCKKYACIISKKKPVTSELCDGFARFEDPSKGPVVRSISDIVKLHKKGK